MNLDLLESFGQNYPEDFDGSLDCVSIAITCAFNKRGTILAVGCNDGRIVLWDFLTRGIAKIISAHVHPLCSLSWSRNGHKLISAATDNTVCVWDVLTGECDKSFRFPSPILKVQFSPRNSEQFLVCPLKHAAVLMNVNGTHKKVPLDDDGDLNVVASYDRRGEYIYTGNSRGKLLVFKATNLELKASCKVTTGTSSTTAIKSIEFARRGDTFLINTADRVIRVYESGEVLACGKNGEPEPTQKLQDLVNKTLWKKCCFSGDGEYICAGSARQHSLYIWEKSIGNLVKILHGTKGEVLLDVVWHPVRPVIASISSGVVSIWAQNQVENWSAFAPDFKELDENVEYEEKESEFDLEDEDKEVEETKGPQDIDEEVDVTSVDPITAFVSSDEEEEDPKILLYLPVSPDIDDPEGELQQEAKLTKPKEIYDDSSLFDGEETEESSQDVQAKEKKRKTTKADTASPKRSKGNKPVDVNLPGAPTDEIHPLLNTKKPQDKQPKRQNSSSNSRSNKSSKGRESKSRRDRDYY